MFRAAFTRARQYLYYDAPAVWNTRITSFLLALLMVVGLCLIGLMLELMAYQGVLQPGKEEAVKAWANQWLAPESRQEFLQQADQGYGLVALAIRRSDAWYADVFSSIAAHMSWTRNNASYLNGLTILLLLCACLYAALRFNLVHAAARASLSASQRLRRAIYQHNLRVGRMALPGFHRGDALSSFTRDLEAVQEAFYRWLTVTYVEPLRFLLALGFALLLDCSDGFPWLTITFVMLGLFLWLMGRELGHSLRRRERLRATQASEDMAAMQEALQMARLIKAFGMDRFQQRRMERLLEQYNQHMRQRYLLRGWYQVALTLLITASLCILGYAIGWNLLNDNLSWPRTLTMIIAFVSMALPFQRLLHRQQKVQVAERAATTLFKFLDTEDDVRQVVGAECLPSIAQAVEFDDVSLTLPGHAKPILSQITLRIPAGERWAVIGQDEIGKHALAYLLPRFLDPTSGEIRIDGFKLPKLTLESIRAQIGMVMQSDLTFSDTVTANIGCGDPNYTLPQIMDAAKEAHAHQFISSLPQGYDTIIGEWGHPLTLGEQYRIALARVILRNPNLVIIEEPPSGSLDEATKSFLDDTMSRFLEKRTALFLAHRLSTIKNADRLVLIHQGQLDAMGHHEDLIHISERYRHLLYLEYHVFAGHGDGD